MLASILRAAGLRATQRRQRRHADPRGGAAPRAVRRHRRRAVQLPAALVSARSSPVASACLNVAPDHLDWHGVVRRVRCAPRAGSTQHTQIACVYNVADPRTEQLVEEADVVEGCRAIGFTLGVPALVDARRRRRRPGRPGLRRAAPAPRPPSSRRSTTCRATRRASRRTTSPTRWPRPRWPGPTACRPPSVRDGLRAFRARPAPHRRGRRRSTACASSTTPRRPTRTRPRPPGRSSSTSCGSPAACSRAPTSTSWSPARADAAARRRAHRRRPGADRRGAGPTRAGCPGRRRRPHRHWGHGPWSVDVMAASRSRHGRATSSCSRRPPRRWTCSPTTARAVTPSRRRCAGSAEPRGT